MNELKCPKCGNVFTVDEADYAFILQQVRTAEFDAEVTRRLEDIRQSEAQAQQLALQKQEMKNSQALRKKEDEIAELKAQLQGQEKEKEAVRLKEQLSAREAMAEKDAEIAKIRTESAAELKAAQEQIEFYKDMKARLSTKMIGESLEVHCSTQYNQFMRALLPNAYFEKDNEVVEGTKGDFVFRDKAEDGTESVSILFEMKNEADATATKHKNEQFFKKLDDDRRKKNCEYAVLVSLLEPESELYNAGIVDVSYKYEKMFVIRPQCFLPLISILVQAARKSLKYKQDLAIERQRSIDVSAFEDKVNDIRDKIGNDYRLAKEKFDKAIEDIDKSIKALEATKAALQSSERHMRLADSKTEELTIRKLTRDNPTMKAKFDALKEES